MEITRSDLHSLLSAGALRWTDHAVKRLIQRGISQAAVRAVLQSGEIIEQYPSDYPNPSCLVFGMTVENRPLHVVCAVGHHQIWIITAYYPSPDKWEHDYKTRKKVSP
jgi:hypothetical protein